MLTIQMLIPQPLHIHKNEHYLFVLCLFDLCRGDVSPMKKKDAFFLYFS